MRKTVEQRRWDAEALAGKWLADANELSERGRHDKAEVCYQKAQFWLDRSNLLSGQADRPAPKR